MFSREEILEEFAAFDLMHQINRDGDGPERGAYRTELRSYPRRSKWSKPQNKTDEQKARYNARRRERYYERVADAETRSHIRELERARYARNREKCREQRRESYRRHREERCRAQREAYARDRARDQTVLS